MSDGSVRDGWVTRVLGIDLDALRGTARSAERGREAQAANRRGIAYPRMLLRWRSAQAEALGALDRVGKAYLALPNVQADPRFPDVRVAISRLPTLVPELGGDLADLLDKGIGAGTDAGIAAEALAVIRQYRAAIAGAATLGAFERVAARHVGDLAVVRTLDGALAEIAGNLEAAA